MALFPTSTEIVPKLQGYIDAGKTPAHALQDLIDQKWTARSILASNLDTLIFLRDHKEWLRENLDDFLDYAITLAQYYKK